jgi:hypothetical protein
VPARGEKTVIQGDPPSRSPSQVRLTPEFSWAASLGKLSGDIVKSRLSLQSPPPGGEATAGDPDPRMIQIRTYTGTLIMAVFCKEGLVLAGDKGSQMDILGQPRTFVTDQEKSYRSTTAWSWPPAAPAGSQHRTIPEEIL